MGNEHFFSLSPSRNFSVSLPLADGAMTINKITFIGVFLRANAFLSDANNPSPRMRRHTSGTFSVAGAKIQVYS